MGVRRLTHSYLFGSRSAISLTLLVAMVLKFFPRIAILTLLSVESIVPPMHANQRRRVGGYADYLTVSIGSMASSQLNFEKMTQHLLTPGFMSIMGVLWLAIVGRFRESGESRMHRCLLVLAAVVLSGCGEPLPPAGQNNALPQQPAPDAAEGPKLQNPLMRSMGQLLDNSYGDQADVGDVIAEADSILADVKEENADAIKAVNRQVRLGSARPPNLLVIVLDDVGYGELGCYGNPSDSTPFIDSLAGAGLRFSDFYAGASQDAGSWWCLLTGQDTSRAVRGNTVSFALQPQTVTLAETLWQAGYSTGFVGRWGLGADPRSMPHLHGFDEWFGLSEDDSETSDPLQHLFSNGARVRLVVENDRDPLRTIQQAVVAEAVSYLSRHAKEPFFLISSLSTLPTSDRSRSENLTETDENVGRILAAVENEKLTDKTIVFLLSDNGAAISPTQGEASWQPNGEFRGTKGSLYEGGIRVPLIVRWPKKAQAGQIVSRPFAVWDLLPTLAELAGAMKQPRRLDGISMVPAMLNKPEANERLLYWESGRPELAQAVRRGKWKVVRSAGRMAKEDVELYDLAADPGETTNAAAEHPEVVDEFIR